MPSIDHEIKINASTEAVRAALTTNAGIAGWQTPHVEGDGAVGSTWRFIFDGRPEFAWRIDEAGPSRIAWTCTAGPGDSAGTEAVFTIATASDGKTHLLLGHTGWADTDGNFRKCYTIWGVLLHHLKQAVETGAPAPAFP